MDHKPPSVRFSALDFEIVRNAYRTLVVDSKPDDATARRIAAELVRDLTEFVDVDDELIQRIIG